ncbi:MAG: hypothetical protein A3E21_03095 [Sulfurimonas sp. RIFCSPHIGHO2_12_FULL_36_9]|uniref:GGDEF domain-containing protein n=1 Tax=Sulfurimonas sp. RIFCSPLOWO2_12_36_12 TaxID=1802253 RepID=UPI0008CADA45|nr:GGDEF domain-containing protein [Sulfurimonas sp. RIFCSPLOWO2_12_36_12]OHD97180.1 MAG: hypothetical protein A3E21_03095 [Sulfurimonas sp. RIFCSPHIGHO2_12_FULL_36_9]OHD98923.1 MAG: hypothetical protein A3J26_00280 [Sulfurimonas sp. RIFCSPLOWO2_02_FULL_36_28]OHE02358.1 MAG: hypothetical protein A2W82_09690 [Sulfurimonas sp. RIFCSPLOWO2_12_36_12]OHE04555.1 MAG: hypothetical protein A3K14_03180 [Sulfurimonas sp. RIFCSPLOWO2_12_FULL_36_74]
MWFLNCEKKSNGLFFFIFVTFIPILAITAMFSYAYFHIKTTEVVFTTEEIEGLRIIAHIKKTVFDIQKIRGLSGIKNPDQMCIDNIEALKETISNDLKELEEELLFYQVTPQHFLEKNESLKFINSANNNSLENRSFEYFSQIIDELMMLSSHIAYQYKLVLDSDLNSYILINNVVYLLPELIEHNAQIRAIASSMENGALISGQKQHIIMQLHKIKEKLHMLDYNFFQLHKSSDNSKIKIVYDTILEAQNSIINFANEELLGSKSTTIKPNGIFALTTKNIDLIIGLYDANLDILNENLEKRLYESEKFSVYIILSGVASVLFIIFINIIFYAKNRKFIHKVEELTITDSMTSLYNRRYFDEVFENNLKIQQRAKQTLMFIMLDIDFFKLYNDTYGHHAGDLAIKTVAKNLKNSLKRAGDMAFRLGGEEFGILCIGMNSSEALSFANGIREKVESEKIEHTKNSASKYLTISMGLVVIEPDFINNVNDLYKQDDEALYKAKESGRNLVVVYGS